MPNNYFVLYLGNTSVGPKIKEMWEQEKVHRQKFEELITAHRARPSLLYPLWHCAGYVLGAGNFYTCKYKMNFKKNVHILFIGTALMGPKAAMACTVAVETVIVEHYNDQLRDLMEDPKIDPELLETIKKFRDDEQEHHDCGIEHGAEQAPFYNALTQVIKTGCKVAIEVAKRV